DIVSGRSFGWSVDWAPGRQRMLEERAGMRSTGRPSRSLFRTLRVYGRLALQTDLKSGVRTVTEQRNPRLAPYLFDFRRTYVGEERDGAPLGVGPPKEDAANLRRVVKSRGGELKNGERRAAEPRAGREGRPDPIQVRFDHSQTLDT